MNGRCVSVWVVLALLAAGCSTAPVIEDPCANRHIVSIGRDGGLEVIEPGRPIRENPGRQPKAMMKQAFGHIVDGIDSLDPTGSGPIDVVIFIHGGLNTKKTSLERAVDIYPLVLRDSPGKYPIFVNWRSGPISTYSAHLGRIRQGEIFTTARLTAPVYLFSDVATSLVNAPKSWLVTGGHMVETTVKRDDSYLDAYTAGNHNVLFTGNKNSYERLGRTLKWLGTGPFKLATTPFAYTMAKPAWDIMLRRTNTPFYTPEDLENATHNIGFGRQAGSGALYELLLALRDDIAKRKSDGRRPVRITLVGHSMGAIIVNRILSLRLDLPINNVVHMASADSITNLLDRVVPFIERENARPGADVRFYSLSLHPENEDREASVGGLSPSGSLLVWIDNMYTTPETVLDKRSGRWTNMERALPLISAQARSKMFFKIYGLNDCGTDRQDGVIAEPQEHGDFDNLPFWREETWWGLASVGAIPGCAGSASP